MTSNILYKLVVILIYVMIIILVILFLDLLMKYTIRNNRAEKIKSLAENSAREKNKPLIIFDSINHGSIINTDGSIEDFNGDIIEIADQIKDNSCVLLVIGVLEYLDINELNNIIKQFRKISGNDFYSSNLEKNAPRIFFDYKIKNIMDKSFYLPNEQINWNQANDLQKNTQKFYIQVFKVVPYNFFS